MLEVHLKEKCCECGQPITISVVYDPTTNYESPKGIDFSFQERVTKMDGNKSYSIPFSLWGDVGAKGVFDGSGFSTTCNECGAMYSLRMDGISLHCDLTEVDNEANFSEEFLPTKKLTFKQWLKKQQDRNDSVGDFARDAFWAEGKTNKREAYRDHPSYPKRATEKKEWVQFLSKLQSGNRLEVLKTFEVAWAEYEGLHLNQFNVSY
ncbi:hypothetical protein [Halodesulfovibrio sp.]|jgi:hypothetical protein|uniref:hypothetical protein n=1 Tax=Halodesulfovibrio sp. TaxID=1912772 RepID=UPI0025CC8C4F|nr:hypothetical protein [Halodesulfovibrio sp.]MCT4625678.1 sterile alpha motif-like domain-containing protein [Halodesulfovibrio sp.]